VNCIVCEGGKTVAATRPKAVDRGGRVAVIRDVPVEVCDNCGEVYIDAAVAKQLDVLFRRMLDGPVDQVVGHFEPAAA
jgi:YgiT-type zinc finger domain-containing protein